MRMEERDGEKEEDEEVEMEEEAELKYSSHETLVYAIPGLIILCGRKCRERFSVGDEERGRVWVEGKCVSMERGGDGSWE